MPARKAQKKKQTAPVSEALGIALLGLGTLYFLALVSYDPKDLPSWIWFSHIAPQNEPIHNFIGIIGAISAGVSYFLMGAASYLLATALLGFGVIKLLVMSASITTRIPWIIVFIITGACLLELQDFALQTWEKDFNIHGAGGWVGFFIFRKLTEPVLGLVGSGIFLTALYAVSLFLMTGLHPVQIVQKSRQWLQQQLAQREKEKHARADLKEKLALDQKKLLREQRKLEKELRRSKPSKESQKSTSQEKTLPVPKIFDANTPRPRSESNRKPDSQTQLDISTNATFEGYQLPAISLLQDIDTKSRQAADPDALKAVMEVLVETLQQFGIQVSPGDITRGPSITRYEVYPDKGVRVDKIVTLERDLALATRAEKLNILAPVPGKDTVGIEIANSQKITVTLRELLESEDWEYTKAQIPFALGKDVYGRTIIADLAKMPHLLVAGTTGSGKSVCINSMVASMLYRFSPNQLRMIMIDPKVVELQIYNRLPHLVVPVVTDPKKVLLALRWVIDEMEKRYQLFAKSGVRNIAGYNELQKTNQKNTRQQTPDPADQIANQPAGESNVIQTNNNQAGEQMPDSQQDDLPEHLPYIVVIVDELADLMQTAPADVESAIARITQMARAAGIHMIIATQTPRRDVITGVIKANVPSRIAFQVASKIDSRVILDENGAERLLGQGDMLYLPPGTSRLLRAQGVFVADSEISDLVDFVSQQHEPSFEVNIKEQMESNIPDEPDISPQDEQLITKAIEVLRQEKVASTSMLQRRLRLGYTRAARIVDILEQRGILGPGDGSKPREILVDLDSYVADH